MTFQVGLRAQKRLYREGLMRALEEDERITVVGAAERLVELLRLVQVVSIDVLVVEIDDQHPNVAGFLSALLDGRPQLKVVALHEGLDAYGQHRLRRSGVSGFVDKRAGLVGLTSVVVGAEASVAVEDVIDLTLQAEPRRMLTVRELEVLELVATGLTSRVISMCLDVSQKTVENHKQRIFHKLNVQSQSQAVCVALREGLISAVPIREPVGAAAGADGR